MKVYVINYTSKLTGYKTTFRKGYATFEAAVDFLRHRYGGNLEQVGERAFVTKCGECEIVEVCIN